MSGITRLSYDGYTSRRAGSFAGKTPAVVSAHPVGRITRLSYDGYTSRRAGSFAGKTPGVATAVVHNALMLSMRTMMGR